MPQKAQAMPQAASAAKNRYPWATSGDVNAFFGLMLDNIADLLLTVSLLSAVFEFPAKIALRYMVPGTAIGVFVGDVLFFFLALRLARRTGRSDVTAMPLGLDTPSTLGMVFFVLGPAFIAAKQAGMGVDAAAIHTWHIGVCAIVVSGLFKLLCALGSNWIRSVLPRAGLLGSLTAVALVLISFLPLIEVLHAPVVGFLALAVVLTTLVARVPLPFRIPGALGSLLIAGSMYYALKWAEVAGILPPAFALPHELGGINPAEALLPTEWLSVFTLEWFSAFDDSLRYLPIVIPFALGTVVGGIDCTESAAAVGDEYDTGQVIGIEAFATLVAGLCGGVVQTTPYIGHPAYKAMGGRAAYTLATAIFVGSAGVLGYFGYLYVIIPKVTVYPILIFIGLEITAQSFLATKRRHYPAVALACVPALAQLAIIYLDNVLGDASLREAGISAGQLANPALVTEIQTLRMLSSGFIVTSLLWSSALAALIDRRLWRGAAYFFVAGLCALFGIIHSPVPGGAMFLPWRLGEATLPVVSQYVGGYVVVGLMLLVWGAWLRATGIKPLTDDSLLEHDTP
jgi:AGZA family xanthine/uracil permease-like MFS transporter